METIVKTTPLIMKYYWFLAYSGKSLGKNWENTANINMKQEPIEAILKMKRMTGVFSQKSPMLRLFLAPNKTLDTIFQDRYESDNFDVKEFTDFEGEKIKIFVFKEKDPTMTFQKLTQRQGDDFNNNLNFFYEDYFKLQNKLDAAVAFFDAKYGSQKQLMNWDFYYRLSDNGFFEETLREGKLNSYLKKEVRGDWSITNVPPEGSSVSQSSNSSGSSSGTSPVPQSGNPSPSPAPVNPTPSNPPVPQQPPVQPAPAPPKLSALQALFQTLDNTFQDPKQQCILVASLIKQYSYKKKIRLRKILKTMKSQTTLFDGTDKLEANVVFCVGDILQSIGIMPAVWFSLLIDKDAKFYDRIYKTPTEENVISNEDFFTKNNPEPWEFYNSILKLKSPDDGPFVYNNLWDYVTEQNQAYFLHANMGFGFSMREFIYNQSKLNPFPLFSLVVSLFELPMDEKTSFLEAINKVNPQKDDDAYAEKTGLYALTMFFLSSYDKNMFDQIQDVSKIPVKSLYPLNAQPMTLKTILLPYQSMMENNPQKKAFIDGMHDFWTHVANLLWFFAFCGKSIPLGTNRSFEVKKQYDIQELDDYMNYFFNLANQKDNSQKTRNNKKYPYAEDLSWNQANTPIKDPKNMSDDETRMVGLKLYRFIYASFPIGTFKSEDIRPTDKAVIGKMVSSILNTLKKFIFRFNFYSDQFFLKRFEVFMAKDGLQTDIDEFNKLKNNQIGVTAPTSTLFNQHSFGNSIHDSNAGFSIASDEEDSDDEGIIVTSPFTSSKKPEVEDEAQRIMSFLKATQTLSPAVKTEQTSPGLLASTSSCFSDSTQCDQEVQHDCKSAQASENDISATQRKIEWDDIVTDLKTNHQDMDAEKLDCQVNALVNLAKIHTESLVKAGTNFQADMNAVYRVIKPAKCSHEAKFVNVYKQLKEKDLLGQKRN